MGPALRKGQRFLRNVYARDLPPKLGQVQGIASLAHVSIEHCAGRQVFTVSISSALGAVLKTLVRATESVSK